MFKQSRKVCTCLHGLGRFAQVAATSCPYINQTFVVLRLIGERHRTRWIMPRTHTHMCRPLALLRVLSVCVSTFGSHFSHVIQNTEMRWNYLTAGTLTKIRLGKVNDHCKDGIYTHVANLLHHFNDVCIYRSMVWCRGSSNSSVSRKKTNTVVCHRA